MSDRIIGMLSAFRAITEMVSGGLEEIIEISPTRTSRQREVKKNLEDIKNQLDVISDDIFNAASDIDNLGAETESENE